MKQQKQNMYELVFNNNKKNSSTLTMEMNLMLLDVIDDRM